MVCLISYRSYFLWPRDGSFHKAYYRHTNTQETISLSLDSDMEIVLIYWAGADTEQRAGEGGGGQDTQASSHHLHTFLPHIYFLTNNITFLDFSYQICLVSVVLLVCVVVSHPCLIDFTLLLRLCVRTCLCACHVRLNDHLSVTGCCGCLQSTHAKLVNIAYFHLSCFVLQS